METKDKNPHAKQAKKAKSNKIGKEDEEDLDSMDPKFEKFIIISTIVITVALGLALIFPHCKAYRFLDFSIMEMIMV